MFVVCCLWFGGPLNTQGGSWRISMGLKSLTFCETFVPVKYFQLFELIESIEHFEHFFSAQLFYNTPE